VSLVRGLGANVVGVQFLIELVKLNGRDRLKGEQVGAVLAY
jgi:adenine/guanine phosphoribosyltransferase-like PRPP-binding protein